ncbi:MAG: Malate/L-lactate dehydrogenase, partial [Verrucomicrobia bacterium]|nr:Malate/L-lactate dehydrogenase [Verrucomicrobiota bacterium]
AMYFARQAAPHGQIALIVTNASAAMAPWGGRQQLVGTNPWSICAPAGKHPPMVLDIANTAVARGKIYLARQEGRPIPLGWALNAAGEPTTDPVDALAGLILPMGEHKGYGIAVMMDVLAGVLSGSAFGSGVRGPYQSEQRSGCGHLVITLDIAAFISPAAFDARMEKLIAELKAAPLAAGAEEIFFPGELEARSDQKLRGEGIELPEKTVADLASVAEATGTTEDFPFPR